MWKVVDVEKALGRSPMAKEWASYMVAKCQSLGLPCGKNPELGLREIRQELSKFSCLWKVYPWVRTALSGARTKQTWTTHFVICCSLCHQEMPALPDAGWKECTRRVWSSRNQPPACRFKLEIRVKGREVGRSHCGRLSPGASGLLWLLVTRATLPDCCCLAPCDMNQRMLKQRFVLLLHEESDRPIVVMWPGDLIAGEIESGPWTIQHR